MKIAAIDLGGTRSKAALVEIRADETPRILAHGEPIDVATLSAEAALRVATGQIRALGDADAVALALPGRQQDGIVTSLPGKFPGMEGIDVRTRLRIAVELPVHSSNDALSAGVGEAVAGAAVGASRAVMVTIGTGIGVAVVHQGRPLGDGPLAGGILGGQIPISSDSGPVDTAGNRGTIEARCRAQRILGEAQDAGCTASTIAEVYELVRSGDANARAGIRSWQAWFLRSLVALAHAHAPDVMVVAGGPVRPGSPLLDGLEPQLQAACWPGYTTSLRPATLGDAAGLVGAAHLCWTAATGRSTTGVRQ